MVSELEKQRLENIERNQRALREFQLKEAANLAFGDKEQKRSNRSTLGTSNAKKRKQKLDNPTPPRRVRNLRRHGISEEDRKKYFGSPEPAVPEPSRASRDEARKEGELQIQDLVGNGEFDRALEIMQTSFGGKASQGDLFKPDLKISDTKLAKLRDELSGQMVADERDIKVVPERITSIAFHPSAEKRIVLAGDKMGELGVWDTDRPEDEGLVNFKFHTRGLATICVDPENTSKVYTGSYDGSIRCLDLQKGKSTESFVYDWNLEAGISDFALVDPHTLYYSTLDGHFGIHDMRTKTKPKEPFTLCDKKIGGFSVNPLNHNEVATASLDRTLKIWDLRKPYQLEVEEGEEAKGAFLAGTYSSRLSISASSWNTSGQIVCNGYDNTINVFDLANYKYGEGNVELTPTVRIQHNCQTGRWVSILKARWQERPRDGAQKFVIGNMKRFADIFSGSGQQLAHLDADHLTAVPAVSQFHRTENWVVGGNASGKVYMWTPRDDVKDEVKDEVQDNVKDNVQDNVKDEVKDEFDDAVDIKNEI